MSGRRKRVVRVFGAGGCAGLGTGAGAGVGRAGTGWGRGGLEKRSGSEREVWEDERGCAGFRSGSCAGL